jgi:hypothetical protein
MYHNMLHPIIKIRTRLTKRRALRRVAGPSPLDEGLGITIRFAYPDDAAALQGLAALDSKPVPPGPLLVAEVAGELWAAISVTGEAGPIADPFRHTAELVVLLRERADRLTRGTATGRAPRPVRRLPAYD